MFDVMSSYIFLQLLQFSKNLTRDESLTTETKPETEFIVIFMMFYLLCYFSSSNINFLEYSTIHDNEGYH